MELKDAAAAKPKLPPGFRFRPTDEELIVHYLRRRALASPMPAAVDIPDIRILAHDPSDLLPPGFSEQERYFFTCKEAKYVKGRRANRATGAGYWKATGKEKPVAVAIPAAAARGAGGQQGQGQAVLVGMKRSLVFYRGKPPAGSKTDWVMHEYRLAGAGLAPCRARQDGHGGDHAAAVSTRPAEGWVLCRVFRKKKGSAAASRSNGDGEEEAGESESAGAGADADAASGPGFIDFFARADAAGRRQRRAASPVVSSSCLTDASPERQQYGRDQQETTSRGA